MQEKQKKITRIFVETEKKKAIKIMEGLTEIVIVISIPTEISKQGGQNKLIDEDINHIYQLLDQGWQTKAIADWLNISQKTVYNYKKIREQESDGGVD